jgi:hypothetical protein
LTRTERIIVLLDHYVDVENGLQDRAFRTDDFLPRMCRSWSHPSYVELRRLIGLMQSSEPRLYWHLAERYFRYVERRVAYCPRCTAIYPAAKVGDLHKHGQKAIALVPRVMRQHLPVSKRVVDKAIAWLEQSFVGEPFVPDDLLALVA